MNKSNQSRDSTTWENFFRYIHCQETSIHMQNITNNVKPAVLTRSLKWKKSQMQSAKNVVVPVVALDIRCMRMSKSQWIWFSIKLQSNLLYEIKIHPVSWCQIGFVAWLRLAQYFNNKGKNPSEREPNSISITANYLPND